MNNQEKLVSTPKEAIECLEKNRPTGGYQMLNEALDIAIAALEKIIEYEGLEEQGLLLRLPCKIGDTVYVVPSAVNYKLNLIDELGENNRVYEQTVSRIEMFEQGYGLTTCDGANLLLSKFYGETWFLTREEAEKKLKELEEQKNNGNIG